MFDRIWSFGFRQGARREETEQAVGLLRTLALDMKPPQLAALVGRLAAIPRSEVSDDIINLLERLGNIAETSFRVVPVVARALWRLVSNGREPFTSVLPPLVVGGEPTEATMTPDADKAEASGGASESKSGDAADAGEEAEVDEDPFGPAGEAISQFEARQVPEESLLSEKEAGAAAPKDIEGKALRLLTSILTRSDQRHLRLVYARKAARCLKQGHNPSRMFELVWAMVDDFPVCLVRREGPRTKGMAIEELNEQEGLLELVLDELKQYKIRAAHHARDNGLFEDEEETEAALERKRAEMEVDAGVPHVQAIRARLSFISNVCVASSLSISLEQINEIWSYFVSGGQPAAPASGAGDAAAASSGVENGFGSLCEPEMEAFMLLLRRATSGPDVGQLIDFEAAAKLYVQRMVDPVMAPPEQVGTSQFDCLRGFFFSINDHLEKLHQPIGSSSDDFQMLVPVHDLVGIQYLWRVALEAEPEGVGTAAIMLLAQLYSKMPLDADAAEAVRAAKAKKAAGADGQAVAGADSPKSQDAEPASRGTPTEDDATALLSVRRAYVMRCVEALKDCTKGASTVAARRASRAIAALRQLISSADEEMEEATSAVTMTAAERVSLQQELRKVLKVEATPEELEAEAKSAEGIDPDQGLVPHSTSMAGNIVALKVENSIPKKELPIGKEEQPKHWLIKVRSTQPVLELSKRVARLLGLVSSQVHIRVKNKLFRSPAEYKKTLQQVGATLSSTKVVAAFNAQPIDATDGKSPMLVDPNASSWRDTQLTHAAEKMVSEVFARYCNDKGTLDRKGILAFFAAVGVTDHQSTNEQRLRAVFKQFDTTPNGEITYKGFNQFYTEACKSRMDKVQSDVANLGYNLYTLRRDRPWPEERKEAEAKKRAAEKEKREKADKEAQAKREAAGSPSAASEGAAAEGAERKGEAKVKELTEDEKKAKEAKEAAEKEEADKKQAEEKAEVLQRQIEGCGRREDRLREVMHAKIDSHPRRILIGDDSTYDVLMNVLRAAADASGDDETLAAMDATADKTWTMLMALPTKPSVLRSLGGAGGALKLGDDGKTPMEGTGI